MGWEALTKHQDSQEELVPNARKHIDGWVSAVHTLIVTIEGYVLPLREDGRVLCHRERVEVAEEGLGNYEIERLSLEFRQVVGTVDLIPKSALLVGVRLPNGAWRVGVSGRVNLTYGAMVVPLTRKDGEWFIGLDGDLVLLDQGSFEVAITSLLQLG